MLRRLGSIFALLFFAACGQTDTEGLNTLTQPPPPTVECATLAQDTCAAAAHCAPHSCPGCFDETIFVGCLPLVGDGAAPACPEIDCPACSDLEENMCNDVGACNATYCLDCDGNQFFTACSDAGTISPCPDIVCPEDRCQFHDEASCAADPECHRVFTEQSPACDCQSPGCCQEFERCAVGGKANCSDDELACRAREPLCEGPYVVSYEGFCYEGCVLREDCDP